MRVQIRKVRYGIELSVDFFGFFVQEKVGQSESESKGLVKWEMGNMIG